MRTSSILVAMLVSVLGCDATLDGYQFSATISAADGELYVDGNRQSTPVSIHVWWQRYATMSDAALAPSRSFRLTVTGALLEVAPGYCQRLCVDTACLDGLIVVENIRIQLYAVEPSVRIDGTCEDIDGVFHSIAQ